MIVKVIHDIVQSFGLIFGTVYASMSICPQIMRQHYTINSLRISDEAGKCLFPIPKKTRESIHREAYQSTPLTRDVQKSPNHIFCP